MVGSRRDIAVVAEDGFYCGLVDLTMVSEALGEHREAKGGG